MDTESAGPPQDVPDRPPANPLPERALLAGRVSRAWRASPGVMLLCLVFGAVVAPLITVAIGQTPTPDGDLPAPMLTAIPASLAGALSAMTYAAFRQVPPVPGTARPVAGRLLPPGTLDRRVWERLTGRPVGGASGRTGRRSPWVDTLLAAFGWGLSTAFLAGLMLGVLMLGIGVLFTVPLAMLGAVSPFAPAEFRFLPLPPALLALVGVPPIAWAPLIAGLLRFFTGTTLAATAAEATSVTFSRRLVTVTLPLVFWGVHLVRHP